MVITCVTVFVKSEKIQDFIQATIINHQASIKEPGNLRFDFLQSREDPARFFLYEAYESETSTIAHKLAPHYLKWRDTVKDWMAKPREGVPHQVICPTEINQW